MSSEENMPLIDFIGPVNWDYESEAKFRRWKSGTHLMVVFKRVEKVRLFREATLYERHSQLRHQILKLWSLSSTPRSGELRTFKLRTERSSKVTWVDLSQ